MNFTFHFLSINLKGHYRHFRVMIFYFVRFLWNVQSHPLLNHFSTFNLPITLSILNYLLDTSRLFVSTSFIFVYFLKLIFEFIIHVLKLNFKGLVFCFQVYVLITTVLFLYFALWFLFILNASHVNSTITIHSCF